METRNSESRTVGGYASVFNTASKNLGGFTETIDARAFDQSRESGWPDVIARYNHNDDYLLGTTAAGTLRLSIDDTGLAYEVDLPSARADVLELITRGDVTKSSFAFRVPSGGDDWDYDDDTDTAHRHVSVALLADVAPVNVPAYDAATVGLRSLASAKDATVEDVEQLAATGELRKLFKRSDVSTDARLFGPVARMLLLKEQSGA